MADVTFANCAKDSDFGISAAFHGLLHSICMAGKGLGWDTLKPKHRERRCKHPHLGTGRGV